MSPPDEIIIRAATVADVDSLATTIPRAWVPDAVLNQIFPDRPGIRRWWAQVYTVAISNPTYHILVAVDGAVVVGVITLALWRFSAEHPEATPGLCTLIPLIDEHDARLGEALIEQVSDRRRIMGARANFMVDLLGVDRVCQSMGVGRQLVKRACEIADDEKAGIFLQTTAAREYYVKLGLGFEVEKAEDGGPGGIIIRQPR